MKTTTQLKLNKLLSSSKIAEVISIEDAKFSTSIKEKPKSGGKNEKA